MQKIYCVRYCENEGITEETAYLKDGKAYVYRNGSKILSFLLHEKEFDIDLEKAREKANCIIRKKIDSAKKKLKKLQQIKF